MCVFLGLLFTMDNNSYIKPLRPSREIKIVISVCFLLARLCDRGGCVFVRGCGAVTFSGASRCVPRAVPPHLRARAGPPRARTAAGRGRGHRASPRAGVAPTRGNEERPGRPGCCPTPAKEPLRAPAPFEPSPAAPGESCREPHGGPGPAGIDRPVRGPAGTPRPGRARGEKGDGGTETPRQP